MSLLRSNRESPTPVGPMPRNEQIERQWRLWILLSSSNTPISALDLVRKLERHHRCTDRTVRRDLEVLRSIGVPVRCLPDGRERLYALHDDGPPLRLDPATLFALRLGVGLLEPFQDTLVKQGLDQLRVQLERRLPPTVAQHFGALADSLTVKQPGAPRYRGDHEVALKTINAALASGKTLTLDYSDLDGKLTRREVDPQAMVYGPRGLYLLATDRGRNGAQRTFRVDRIRSARVGTAKARRLADPERFLEGSLGIHSPEHPPRLVKLRIFDARTARLLNENPWHPSQVVRRSGKHWELELRLTSFRELESRILALGPAAEVVEPASFADQIAALLQRTCARYSPRKRTRPDQQLATIRVRDLERRVRERS